MDGYQKARNEVLYAIQVLAKPRITRDERKFLQTLLHGVAEDLELLRKDLEQLREERNTLDRAAKGLERLREAAKPYRAGQSEHQS